MADALVSPAVGTAFWAASAGAIALCSIRVRKQLDDRKVPLMGVLGAFVFAAQMINRDAKIFVCVDSGETSDVDIHSLTETPNDVHAGEIETSTSLAVRPNLVKMAEASKSVPRFSSRYLDFTSKRGVLWYAHTRRISNTGVMGDPTLASAEKGQKIWEIMVAHLVGMVEDLKGMTLEEIHHRRY